MKFGLVGVLACACAHDASPPHSTPCTVITDERAVSACIGQRVTLKGVVSNSKLPTLLGVDVDAEALRDKPARATGVLTEVTEPPGHDEPGMEVARRAPGTYVKLLEGGVLAKAVAE